MARARNDHGDAGGPAVAAIIDLTLFLFCSYNPADYSAVTMSMEITVFFSGKLPSKAALTRCFKQLGFPLAFERGTGALEHQDGYLPMRLRGEESGIELFTSNDREELKEFEEDYDIKIDPRFTRSATFHWSFSIEEGTVALCFAAALARLVDGAVFEDVSATFLSTEETIARARKDLKDTAPPPKQRATRKADIRHYLKALLDQRKDLALVGRMLVIRPVHHLLRYGRLDRSSNRYEFRLWRACTPLYAPDGSIADVLHDGAFKIWRPHFEPLLMATLAEEVFEPLARITTLTDFASRKTGNTPFRFAQVTSLVLAGERDRAAAIVEETERDYEWLAMEMRQHWDHISGDVERTCAEYHAREAETVKAIKLEHIWEPSPFPVELPASGPPARTDEPDFVTTPWPIRPPWLWQELPQAAGAVCYANDILYRGDDVVLLVALTPAEAEERHRMRETYVLAARPPDGVLATIWYSTLYDRHSPEAPQTKPDKPSIWIRLNGQARIAYAQIWHRERAEGICQITRFSVRDRATPHCWECDLDLKRGTKSIWHHRGGERVYSECALTDAEREAAACPIPGFGEYAVAVERFRNVLRVAGFGEVS